MKSQLTQNPEDPEAPVPGDQWLGSLILLRDLQERALQVRPFGLHGQARGWSALLDIEACKSLGASVVQALQLSTAKKRPYNSLVQGGEGFGLVSQTDLHGP